jgi:ammonium transporter, Amt family
MFNAADIAWVLTATALVMLMTPALAFFYGGLVRRKNLVSTLVQCITILPS